jgi:protoporphyrinogen oxidase
MQQEFAHTIIVGAGPSGLAAAHALSGGGLRPVVFEREDRAGGLMKSYSWNDFVFDIGRKELYTRIPEVDTLWSAILDGDYREYPHRVGSLYSGRILELSGKHRGMFRGAPLPWLIVGGMSLVYAWARALLTPTKTYEQYWHNRTGRVFAQMLAQGYWEKFRGQRWASMPVPDAEIDGSRGSSYSFGAIRQGMKLAAQGGVSTQQSWRHPAKGTGQISEALLAEIRLRMVTVKFGADVLEINRLRNDCYELMVREHGTVRHYIAEHVISSMPIESLHRILRPRTEGVRETSIQPGPEAERAVILAYLFLDEAPRFPHAWLEVNDTSLKCGRITNYAAFNGVMVPSGKTCLCVEFFCDGDDPLLTRNEEEVTNLAIAETACRGLADPAKLVHAIVFKMKRTNAAASWREWQNAWRNELLNCLRGHPQLYHTNRPGTDWATYAGLMAAKAILSGDRAQFDRRADPRKRYDETAAADDSRP